MTEREPAGRLGEKEGEREVEQAGPGKGAGLRCDLHFSQPEGLWGEAAYTSADTRLR